jgi:peroxiredoxin
MIRNKYFQLFSIATILLFFLVMAACSGNDGHPDTFVIKGKLKYTNGNKIVLVQMRPDSLKPIDSVSIDDEGRFTFVRRTNDIGFYLLKLAEDNFVTLLLKNGETAEITGDARQFAANYVVSGSEGSTLLAELAQQTKRNVSRTDSLDNLLDESSDSLGYADIKADCDSAYLAIFQDQQKYIMDFIRKHSQSLASIYALYQVFGRQKVLNEQEHYSYFLMVDSTLNSLHPDNVFVKDLHSRVQEIRDYQKEMDAADAKLKMGKPAPDIALKNVGGIEKRLSENLGHVTLLVFWSSANAASTNFMKSCKWIYKTYSPKGLRIYAVSLDKNRTQWEGFVRENRILWENVSDLTGWESAVVKPFALKAIPYAYVIDEKGLIAAKGLNEQEIANWLNNNYKF